MKLPLLVLILGVGLRLVEGLGCIQRVCQDNDDNVLTKCENGTASGKKGYCGWYKGRRNSGQREKAVDIKCDPLKKIYAPIDGFLFTWSPFGSNSDKCANFGFGIDGTGQWQGYTVKMMYVKLYKFGGTVEKGDMIGEAVNPRCMGMQGASTPPHVRFILLRGGKKIDPTYHLKDCMCTGQICKSNPNNGLIGEAYKSDPRFNGVRGWELDCKDMKTTDEEEEDMTVAPQILSPIDAKAMGRIRITPSANNGGKYKGCENDGIFLDGANKWAGFTVRIYNAKFAEDPGVGIQKDIKQGTIIGTRLDCPDSGINTIFMEIRRNGRLLNATDMIVANSCKVPEIIVSKDSTTM